MRLVFAGSPEAAVPTLRALVASEHEVVAVITREDSPQGRKRVLTPTAVARAAEELGLPVIRANRLDEAVTARVGELGAELGVIVAYGGLVREPLLSLPRLGWINLHFSLLPRWRGAAPVQRALMAGDEITGASVFQLVPELDAGAVYGVLTQAIGPRDTAGMLLESLAVSGAPLVLDVVEALAAGTAVAEEQIGDVTLAPKLSLADGRIDPAAAPSSVLSLIRGVTPEPGAWLALDGLRVKVLEAAAVNSEGAPDAGELALSEGRLLLGVGVGGGGGGAVELLTVQPPGKKPMRAADWWRGRPADASTRVDAPGTAKLSQGAEVAR